jgi:uncharacterized protein YecE (DUF72 family)
MRAQTKWKSSPLPSKWKSHLIPPDIAHLGALVGTGGFEYPDWAGCFYPPAGRAGTTFNATSRECFQYYQQYFAFLEIAPSISQEPQLQQFVELERSSKLGMQFSVKVHGDISHKGIWDVKQGKSLLNKYVTAVSPLVESGRFHTFLIQLDEGQERNRKVLDSLLQTVSVAISHGLDVHVEFRNHTWHQESVLEALKNAGVGICNTDIPSLPQAFPLKAYATSRKGYLRYSGLNLAAWEATAEGAFHGSPAERQRANQSRYDYLYSREELKKRVRGQIQLLAKVDTMAVVFLNHVGAGAAVNALQNVHMLTEQIG